MFRLRRLPYRVPNRSHIIAGKGQPACTEGGMVMIKLQIDHTKCTTPYYCKKCLQICPQAVFMVRELKAEKFKETDPKVPGNYELSTFWIDKCTGCGDCIIHCPVSALKIIEPEGSNG